MSNSMRFLTINDCVAYTYVVSKILFLYDSCYAWKKIPKHSGVIHKHRLLTFNRSVIEACVGIRRSKCARFDSIIGTR